MFTRTAFIFSEVLLVILLLIHTDHFYNDLLELDLNKMTLRLVERGGESPEPRSNHTAVIYNPDAHTANIIVYGGSGNRQDFDSTFIFDILQQRWYRLRTQGADPGARSYHTANIIKNFMVVFGGESQACLTNDLFVLCLVSNKW